MFELLSIFSIRFSLWEIDFLLVTLTNNIFSIHAFCYFFLFFFFFCHSYLKEILESQVFTFLSNGTHLLSIELYFQMPWSRSTVGIQLYWKEAPVYAFFAVSFVKYLRAHVLYFLNTCDRLPPSELHPLTRDQS